jgi:hypothetical protein
MSAEAIAACMAWVRVHLEAGWPCLGAQFGSQDDSEVSQKHVGLFRAKIKQHRVKNTAWHEQLATEKTGLLRGLSRQVLQQLIGCTDQESELFDC